MQMMYMKFINVDSSYVQTEKVGENVCRGPMKLDLWAELPLLVNKNKNHDWLKDGGI